jgi:DNA polymerase-3 subunit delta'
VIGLLDIVGQDQAVGHLQRLLGGARRPHAMIFAGPIGVGRRTTAEALAASLLCSRPTQTPNAGRFSDLADDALLTQACGQCDDCAMTAAGSHPDYHAVYKELAAYHTDADVRNRVMQDLGIAVIRQFLIAPASQAPARGRGKVFVVREADLMSTPAQNALLKTLEEPPAGVTIILLARRSDLLLATTLSRCGMVRFGPLPAEFVRSQLTQRGVGNEEAAFWAAFTAGSIGRAIQLAEAELYPVKCELTGALADLPEGGGELADRLVKLSDELAESAVAASRKADGSKLSKALATRQATGTLLQLIASVYRDALTLSVAADRPLIHADQPEEVQRIAARLVADQLAEIIEQLSQFERMLWQNVNSKIVWDNAVITCTSAAALDV